MRYDVVVVGGGIIGGAIAFRLAQEGLRVALLDSGDMGREASWAGAGMLSPPPDSPSAIPDENPCPRCGMMVPKQVLRCRDCGSYMNPEVEAAAMAQQANRMFRPGGSSGGLRGGGAGFGSGAYNPLGTPSPAMSATPMPSITGRLRDGVSFGCGRRGRRRSG